MRHALKGSVLPSLVTAPPSLTSTTISPVPTVRGRKALEKAIIGKAADLLAGPGGPSLPRGWTLVLNPDGTTTAWNKDKTKDLAKLGRVARSQT